MRTKQREAYRLAGEDIGTFEWAEGSNPKVLQYFADAGHPQIKSDEVAWCAAFVGAMLKRAGLPSTEALNARSYSEWGEEVLEADVREGDIAVFSRNGSSWQGHVAFVSEVSASKVKLRGGNQRDQVNEMWYAKDGKGSKLLSYRRYPEPKIAGFDLFAFLASLFGGVKKWA